MHSVNREQGNSRARRRPLQRLGLPKMRTTLLQSKEIHFTLKWVQAPKR